MMLSNDRRRATCRETEHGQISHEGWLLRMGKRLRRWQQLRHERQELWRLSDATLKDIGLSRADIEREARRPFWDDGEWGRDR